MSRNRMGFVPDDVSRRRGRGALAGASAAAFADAFARSLARLFTSTWPVVFAIVVGLAIVDGAVARGSSGTGTLGTINVAQLPPEGRTVLAEIRAGGPFEFKRDGIVFANREGVLPGRPRGYYAEYTVPTPGERTRGVRRIIAGRGTTGDFRTSGEYYFTNDHYESFRRIVQ